MVKSLVAAIAGIVLAALPVAQEPVERVGAHFTLQFHPGRLSVELAGKLADEALATVESSWAQIERLLGPTKLPPTVLQLYAVTKDYQGKEKLFASSIGLRHHVVRHAEREAHVELWPSLRPQDLTLIGLPRTTRDSLVRAAAELVASQRSPVVAIDPWLAEVFAFGVLEGKQAQAPVYGVDWVFDNRRYEHAASANPRSLRSAVLDERPAGTQAHVLAEEAKALAAQLFAGSGGDWARKLVQAPGKPTKEWRVVREAAVERLLGKDWSKIEAKWQKQIQAVQVPFWLVSPLVSHSGDRLVLAGTRDLACTVYAEDPVPAGAYRIRATCEDHRAPDGGDMRIQLDWDHVSMLGVFLHRDAVEILVWKDGDAKWEQLAEGKATMPNGTRFDVAIEVDVVPNTLVVFIDGREIVRWNCSQRTMRGTWSLARNDGVTFVEGLRIDAAAAAAPAKGK